MPSNISALSYEDGGPAGLVEQSLWDWVSSGANCNNKSALAIVALHQPSDHLSTLLTKTEASYPEAGHFAWSFANLFDAVENLAAIWNAAGVKPGDNVFVLINNSS